MVAAREGEFFANAGRNLGLRPHVLEGVAVLRCGEEEIFRKLLEEEPGFLGLVGLIEWHESLVEVAPRRHAGA